MRDVYEASEVNPAHWECRLDFHCSCDTEQDLNILFYLINQCKEQSFSCFLRRNLWNRPFTG